MHLQLLQRLIWGWDSQMSVDSQGPPHQRSEGDSPTGGLAGHFVPGWDTLSSLHGSWNHQHALQPHRRKGRIWMKPINTSLAINNPQLSVQENQLLHHLKCSTCTYMKTLKGSFKRYAGERKRRRSWRGWVLPKIGAYSSFCLLAFASCLLQTMFGRKSLHKCQQLQFIRWSMTYL